MSRVTESIPEGYPPPDFQINKKLPLGRHPILAAFPGLDRLPIASRLEPLGAAREKLFRETRVDIVDYDMWMYVAPWKRRVRRGRWSPRVAPGVDLIVIGQGHFTTSSRLYVYLDIFHELCHVRQRHAGAELFDPKESYVHRWTEVEAYRFVVDDARRAGVRDDALRAYLEIEWVTREEFRELLEALGVRSD
jgi:hypothetical protein